MTQNSDATRTPYRTLGRSGTVVFEQALGTMTFGAEADEATSHTIIDAYVAGGGNFIDTADVYSAGRSEEIIGRWLAAHPAEAAGIVIATKARFPMGAGPNDHGTSRRHLRTALDESLRRLDHAGEDRVLRVLELHRLAAHQSSLARRAARLEPSGDAAAAVQPAGARYRA
jgi:aryl-alcohol dehydrogenase-like predicted oxidoreductase